MCIKLWVNRYRHYLLAKNKILPSELHHTEKSINVIKYNKLNVIHWILIQIGSALKQRGLIVNKFNCLKNERHYVIHRFKMVI
ncbi:hypothetical protein CUC53_07395 [Aeromonas cavernicola]|uniref:Uncharacterized protein n=1 Tax=Aeromonas cavernicola TaxID=1006623 RepID=A0A2H9U602_9GAMM|nr:hypothetical protein CUC53_07395 [Aeromonas cavernicola]